MSQPAMPDLNEFANQYMAVWNEPDAHVRRSAIAELWAADATHFTQRLESRGYEAIEARITRAHEQFVQTDGFVFRWANEVNGHHNAVMLTWEMIQPDGGKVGAIGTIFVLLGDDGRISRDYQFTHMLP